MTSGTLEVVPVAGIGEIGPGDSIAKQIAEAAELSDGDVVVVTHKIVSKAEGRVVAFDGSLEAHRAIVEGESSRILRRRGDFVIAETHHGFVCANAGVDLSNVKEGSAVLLPRDPDRSARRIRDGISEATGQTVGVIISDTFGRPWRRGVTDVALGSAGIAAVIDLRGTLDVYGRELSSTTVCVADELAAAADLVMGKASQIPAAIIRGVDPSWLRHSSVRDEIVRRPNDDLFW